MAYKRHASLEERLLTGSVLSFSNECWLRVRRRENRGYGTLTFRVKGKPVKRWAHRVAYEEWRGEIPKGMTVDHICEVTSCINPAHLQLVSNAENVRLKSKRKKTY